MQVTVNNDIITVNHPTSELLNAIKTELTYTDKSKQYQLKKMAN